MYWRQSLKFGLNAIIKHTTWWTGVSSKPGRAAEHRPREYSHSVETFSSSVKEILGGCSLIREAANLLLGAGGGVTQVAPASMAPLETQRDKKREQLKIE